MPGTDANFRGRREESFLRFSHGLSRIDEAGASARHTIVNTISHAHWRQELFWQGGATVQHGTWLTSYFQMPGLPAYTLEEYIR